MSRQKKLQTLKELESLLAEKKQREQFNRLAYFNPYPWQKDLLNSSGKNKQTLLMAANRVGKAVRVSEPVLTPSGWVPIGELSIGDTVSSPEGGACRVVGVYPQGQRELYRVHFNDGTFVDCDASHQWRCKSPDRRFRRRYQKRLASGEVKVWDNPNYGEWEVKSLKEIIDDVGLTPRAPRRYSIPVVQCVDYPDKDLPMDPYTVGVLIGDGSTQNACIVHSADEEIFEYVQLGAAGAVQLKAGHRSQAYPGNLSVLRQVGLYGKSVYEKRVPDEYKHSNHRLAVLQGLMDTDGHAGPSISEFVSASKGLAQDVADICRSLGIRCTLKEKKTSWTHKGEKKHSNAWRVSIWATQIPLFRLSRKLKAQCRGVAKNGSENVITRIEPLGEKDECVCIEVDNETHTYIVSNYVVTHNSFIGAANVAFHATGLYPDWWEGHRWEEPISIWAAGVSADSTRDILQNELLGPPDDITMRGSGMIPREMIHETVRRPQIPNALQSVLVRHHTDGVFDGYSRIAFKSFEQGEAKFMGSSVHEIWLDEQPPDGLFTQCITRTANTNGHVTMTFTPEDGVTPVVHQFTKNRKPGMALIGATWDDAPHLDEKTKEQLLAVYGEHEREMRSKGVPVFGSGPVFAVLEEDLICDPFEIPDFWPGIVGLDFGWDHPTAIVWLRWDRDSDTVYVVDCYRKRTETVAYHATAIVSRPSFPVVWPHDGMKHELGAGVSMADQYRMHGVNMLPTHFTNPLAPGESGKGNYKVEPGINALHERMQTGRFKVFSTCPEWFEEFRMYHREQGRIVAIDDDLMSATRYAAQSLRFAEVSTEGRGYSRFSGELKYEDMGLIA